jgi:uncharacterized protein YbjT (DUF2867 family)
MPWSASGRNRSVKTFLEIFGKFFPISFFFSSPATGFLFAVALCFLNCAYFQPNSQRLYNVVLRPERGHEGPATLRPARDAPKKGNLMILITGASGTVGRAVLEEASKTGKPIRAMYRNAADAGKGLPGIPAVQADFADRNSLQQALQGIDTVFVVCSPTPQLVELEGHMIDASKENGARHIVLNSALGAGDYPKSFPSWHRKVEDKLKASGLGYTILRPNGFMQNIVTYNAPSIRAQGAFYAAMGNAKTSLIDVRDVALAAAKVLTAPAEHAGATYELNGPEAVSNDEVAARISRATGQKVRYVDIPEAEQRKSMLEMGMPVWQVTALLELQEYYVAGKCGTVTDVLPRLLGRAPITLDQFLSEYKDSFRGQAAGAWGMAR